MTLRQSEVLAACIAWGCILLPACLLVVDVDAPVYVQTDPCEALDGSVPEDAGACSSTEPCTGYLEICVCKRCLSP